MPSQKLEPHITENNSVVAAKDQVFCKMEDDVVILNTSSGVYFGLDPVGRRVWDLIQEPMAVDTLRDTLMADYEVDADRCMHDLLALLAKLAEHGLIEVALGPDP